MDGARVSASNSAAMPPISKKTTAQTACSLMNWPAVASSVSPVVAHTSAFPSAWFPRGFSAAGSTLVGEGAKPPAAGSMVVMSLLRHQDFSGHLVMTDATELVADDGELTRHRRRDREHVIVAGQDLKVHVDGQHREAVLQVHGRDVEAVGLSLSELQDRVVRPHLRLQVRLAAGARLHDRQPVLRLAGAVALHEAGHALREGGRRDAVRLPGAVLLAPEVPVGHRHREHDAPEEGDADPGALRARGS